MRRACAVLALSALVAGCGGGGGGGGGNKQAPASGTSGTATASTPATRTEIIRAITRSGGSFNPEAIYKTLSPGVVTIISLSGGSGRNALSQQGASLGSGFVVDGAGYVATNAHVVTSDSGKAANAVYVVFSDGNRLEGQIVGTDPFSDIALVKVDPSKLRGPDAKLVVVPLGTTGGLTVGDPVAAIGSPFGEQESLSIGVVSALGRDIESLTRFPIGNAIQTDAAINHGNSGGPLLDAQGQVIGVNSQIRSTGGGGEGVGFAIPVETVKRSIAQLRSTGKVAYSYLGISSSELYPQLAERLHVPVFKGVLVDNVANGSPAQKAGMIGARAHTSFQGQTDIPVGSDVIVAIDGKQLNGPDDMADVIAQHQPGDTVDMQVIRNGRRRTLKVTLGTRPTTTTSG